MGYSDRRRAPATLSLLYEDGGKRHREGAVILWFGGAAGIELDRFHGIQRHDICPLSSLPPVLPPADSCNSRFVRPAGRPCHPRRSSSLPSSRCNGVPRCQSIRLARRMRCSRVAWNSRCLDCFRPGSFAPILLSSVPGRQPHLERRTWRAPPGLASSRDLGLQPLARHSARCA